MTHHYIVQLLDENGQILVDLEPTHTSVFDEPAVMAYHFDNLTGKAVATGYPRMTRTYKDYRLLCKYDELLCWPFVVAGQPYSIGGLEIPRAYVDATMNSTPKACGCGLRAAGCGGIHQDYCDLAGMSEPMTY